MKTFALFVSILVGYLTARKVTDENSSGFEVAVSDALTEMKERLLKLGKSVNYNLPTEINAPFITDNPEQPTTTIFNTSYDQLILSAAAANDIDPQILYRLLYQESRFRPEIINGTVRSSTGALGIAQFMPATAREWLGSEE